MNDIFWFASVILPACIIAGAFVIKFFHDRWLDREIARERDAAAER